MSTKIVLTPTGKSKKDMELELSKSIDKAIKFLDELNLPSIDDEIFLAAFMLINLVSEKDPEVATILSNKIIEVISPSSPADKQNYFFIRNLGKDGKIISVGLAKDVWGLDPQLITENH